MRKSDRIILLLISAQKRLSEFLDGAIYKPDRVYIREARKAANEQRRQFYEQLQRERENINVIRENHNRPHD